MQTKLSLKIVSKEKGKEICSDKMTFFRPHCETHAQFKTHDKNRENPIDHQ